MESLAVDFGQAIQETGEMILRYQKDIQDLMDKIRWMSAKINELELKHETRH
jgi:hypothetical protein